MNAFIKALLFVVVGEMGDKTQLLAMAMAGRYKVRDVMLGVLGATILNHALAVLVGSTLSAVIPMTTVTLAAGVSFLAFGLWTIRGDTGGGDGQKPSRFGPVLTVGIAFFFAEMGDKTQLMTIAIAAEYRQPLQILMGTTLGMLIADGIGVLGSGFVCRYLSAVYIKWLAGMVFMLFGTLSIYETAPAWLERPVYIIPYVLVLAGLVYLIGVWLPGRERAAYRQQAAEALPAKDSR